MSGRLCRPGALVLVMVASLGCASSEAPVCSPDVAEGVDPQAPALGGHTLVIQMFAGLVVLDAAGRRHVPGSEGVGTHSWAPDGTGFFVTWGGVLGFIPIEGGDVQEIYTDWRQVRFPALSPDGETLAVSANLTDEAGTGWEIWLLGRSGENPRFLVDGYHPSWSPDGSRLYFEQHEPTVHLATIDLATGQSTPLLSEGGRDMGIAVSPRGTYAAFSRGSARKLMLYSFGDSSLVALTDGTYYDQYPSFSPTEDLVVFHRQIEDGSLVLQIVVCDLGTGSTTLIDEGDGVQASFAPAHIEP